VGRSTLRLTLESIRAQPEAEGVEVLVVADTFGGQTPALLESRPHVEDLGYRWLEHDAGRHCVGQPQRTYGAQMSTAPFVWFTQDDNIAAEEAFASIECAIDAQPRIRPLFFRFLSHWRQTIWRDPVLQLGNIDADCLVFPRAIAHEVHWGLRYEGDYDAAQQAYQLVGGDVGWCDEVVSISRPDPEHCWWAVTA
jgi:hypothetical protein